MTRTLIQILKDFSAIDDLLFETGGELNETLENWMAINESNLVEKVDSYKLYMEHLDSRIEYFKTIKEQANNAQNILKNMKQSMKDRVEYVMDQMEVDELRGDTFRFKLSAPKAKLDITSQDELPVEFMKEVVELHPDKEKIEAALNEGKLVTGARLIETRTLRSYANTKGK